MTKISKTLLFFGNERLVSGLKMTDAPVLNGLIERGYNIKAVIANHHDVSRSRNNRLLEVASIANNHNIPVLLPDRLDNIVDQISSYKASAAILVAYGRIIPQSVIDLFPVGIINIHPSLLPKYRGPTPIETVIQNGDDMTGVSIMKLTSGMDSGPIYDQVAIPLAEAETKFSLYEKASRAGANLLFEILPRILEGKLQPKPQDETEATYCQLLTKEDAWLKPADYTAAEAERTIRARLGFPKTKTTVLGHNIIITKAHISAERKTPLDISCRDNRFLSIDELIAPSGKTMNSAAFLRGYAA